MLLCHYIQKLLHRKALAAFYRSIETTSFLKTRNVCRTLLHEYLFLFILIINSILEALSYSAYNMFNIKSKMLLRTTS